METKKILTESSHFSLFYVFPVRPPQKFQVQAKISKITPAPYSRLSLRFLWLWSEFMSMYNLKRLIKHKICFKNPAKILHV